MHMTWQARAVGALVALLAAAAFAQLPGQAVAGRKTTAKDFAFEVERLVLPNGLVVLLSPDATVNQVVVDISFAAGALYDPDGKAGLAHLVEHVMAEGKAPAPYRQLLEQRGATGFGGWTTPDRLSYRITAPPEELPLALWANADRLGALGQRVGDEDLERQRRIVLQERIQRVDDVPYARSNTAMMARLYAGNHPLHHGVMGTVETVRALTLSDVQAFAARYLVPANGILTITGRFDAAEAKDWLGRTLARLPAGERAPPPPTTPRMHDRATVVVPEPMSRKPQVRLAWTLADPMQETTDALELGAVLLTLYTDGFADMDVSAHLQQYAGGAIFALDVTMPHDMDKLEASGNAEVVYRYLSQAPMPPDLAAATFHARDRVMLKALTSPGSLATLLSTLEQIPPRPVYGYGPLDRHWRMSPLQIQVLAAEALRGARLTVHARPTRPLPRKVKE